LSPTGRVVKYTDGEKKVKTRLAALLVLLLVPLPALTAQSPADDAARAQSLFDEKKYADAAAILEKLQQRGNPAPAQLILLGMCYTELQELDKASAVLDKAALLAPGSVPLLNARGNLAFTRKRFADAVELFRNAHRLDPKDGNAIAGLVASLSNDGVGLFGQDRIDDARKAFREALDLDPRSVPALRNIGILEMEKGDPAVSARYLERALAVSPGDVQVLRFLFLAKNRQGDTAAMLSILDRLIAAQPADPEPYAVKARLLEQEGKPQEAADLFAKAVDRGTEDPLPYLRVGQARRSRYTLHDAVGKAVQLISALQLQASRAVSKAQTPEDLRGAKLITARVDDIRIVLDTSLSLLREIDGDSVFEQDLARLQTWYPGSVDLLAALGRLYQEKEGWRDALAAWQKILSDHPLDRDAQSGAGLAFEKLGDREQAITAYRRARELEPESADIYAALERVYSGRTAELHQVLQDISFRETRNVVLLRELVKLEEGLGLSDEATAHRARIAEIESGA
jgi:tetratricopeptide (TPR) repeat protein